MRLGRSLFARRQLRDLSNPVIRRDPSHGHADHTTIERLLASTGLGELKTHWRLAVAEGSFIFNSRPIAEARTAKILVAKLTVDDLPNADQADALARVVPPLPG